MLDKSFAKWWLGRVVPFRDVAPEKLAAEREAMAQQQEYNRNYGEFLNQAVLPTVDAIVKTLAANKIVHRVSSWGNQLSLRVHLAWRWGELVIMQSHEDCVTFEHHIITEGEKRGDRKSTRLNSSHANISYAVFCLKKKKTNEGARLRATAA